MPVETQCDRLWDNHQMPVIGVAEAIMEAKQYPEIQQKHNKPNELSLLITLIQPKGEKEKKEKIPSIFCLSVTQ